MAVPDPAPVTFSPLLPVCPSGREESDPLPFKGSDSLPFKESDSLPFKESDSLPFNFRKRR